MMTGEDFMPIPGETVVGIPAMIVSSAEFVADFVPPDYLIDGIVQRRFLYSLTAPTGAGKTAIALLLAASVALGRSINGREVQKGRVLYLAGENPDDHRMRWFAMAQQMEFNPSEIDVHFVPCTFNVEETLARLTREAGGLGGFVLIVVDTAAAFFQGTQENDNVEMGNYARSLRELTKLPGGPAVLVCCHPTKNATNDDLKPRGGGAFLAEVDGNLVVLRHALYVELHWHGKYRGPEFDPMPFQTITAHCSALVDSKGRTIPTVIGRALTDSELKELIASEYGTENRLLLAMEDNPGASMSKLAEAIGATKSTVQRSLKKLAEDRLVRKERGSYELTEKGERAATKARNKLAGNS